MENKKPKLNKSLVSLLVISAMVITGAVAVYASQENEIYEPHEHVYEVVAFSDGTVYLACTECSEPDTLYFEDYINDYNSYIDVVEDGIVNAKDYAYLMQNFPPEPPTREEESTEEESSTETPTATTRNYTTPLVPID